ncbi:MAG TPA: TolC family protein, partial [Polyangiaceae bacterium]|nr:TolC family protein [Polyangiaceae bacterium]
RAGEDVAAADASTAELNAVLDAAVRYLTVAEDETSVTAFNAALETRLELQRVTHELVAQGLRPPIDEGRVQVEVDVARFDLMVAGYRLQQDTVELSTALGLDPTTELRVEPIGDALVSVDDDPKRAAVAAEASRPELQAARAQLAQSQADIESARTARLPTLAVLAQGQAGHTEVLSGIGVAGRNESGQVGISLSIPVLDPVRSAQRTVAEKASVVAAERLRAARLAIRNDAVRAALAVRGSRALLQQAERVRSGASANAATARERYARGMTPVIDELIEAQARERSATSDAIRARLVLQVACARLLASIGGAALVASVQGDHR